MQDNAGDIEDIGDSSKLKNIDNTFIRTPLRVLRNVFHIDRVADFGVDNARIG